MNERISVLVCQRYLATIWFLGSGVLLTLVLALTISGRYGNQVERVWSWFLPTIIPTLSLITGAIMYEARRRGTGATVDRFSFRISTVLSLAYLLLVLATILLHPFSRMTPLELISISNFWLGPVQGLVGIALGTFFASRETPSSS
jgi:hypothetical protein